MAYTPFLADVGKTIGNSMAKTGQSKLAGSAYMGDEQAMQQLMQVNPQMGIQIQERKRAEQQRQLQQQAQAQKAQDKKTGDQRKIYMENREVMDDIFENASKIESFDEAKSYIQNQFDTNSELLGDYADASGFTEETHGQLKEVYGKKGQDDIVQSSKIMADGTVQLVRKSGKVEIVSPEEANKEKIKAAQEYGAELQGLRAGERTSATNAQKESASAFKEMIGVRKNISLYDKGIKLLNEEGADTGPVESMFKSFKAATVELENVQAQLGLNVIQNTTFGSLSEEELKFALNSTFPTNLDAPELADFLVRKRAAQMKLADYLEETAVFLGTPGKGHGIADFLRKRKTQQFSTAKPEQKKNMSDNDYAARKKALGL